jgi:hypothetical protein
MNKTHDIDLIYSAPCISRLFTPLRIYRLIVTCVKKFGQVKRTIISCRTNENRRLALSKRSGPIGFRCNRVKVKTLYHGTTVENGDKIMASGFKIFKHSRGVAHSVGCKSHTDIEHALMYVPQKHNSCILVCDVAIGMHENLSRPVKVNGHRS